MIGMAEPLLQFEDPVAAMQSALPASQLRPLVQLNGRQLSGGIARRQRGEIGSGFLPDRFAASILG
ncbi:hypothetical protein NOVOSPHI9U_150021 [Novosphingobium sp. 9U]|nr:hypothetical protein NOVOSPHI9U_150021 [Novosphingobium sp. 9U]